jgi:hypothetical protein
MLTKRASKCKICREPSRPFRTTCSIECESELGMQLLEKRKRAEAKQVRAIDKVRKDKLKSRSDWMREAQIIFNRYIRARDAGNDCISCGRNTGSKINAGHYLSVGSHPHLRFNESNVHLQCEYCNTYKSGNQAAYRPRLIEKIGLQSVEELESNNDVVKWTVDDLKQIKEKYKLKLKEISK